MGWYFFPGEMGEQAKPQLKALGIVLTRATVTRPEPGEGISFYVEDAGLRNLLDHLGFAETEFEAVPSDIDGVAVLVARGRRRRPQALRTQRRAQREGAAAFAEIYLGAAAGALVEVEAQGKRLGEETERLTRELAAVCSQAEVIALQRAALESVDATVIDALRREFETIAADPRVAKLTTNGGLCVIETADLVVTVRGRRARIGPLRVSLGAFDGSVKIEAFEALGPTAHPIVSTTGVPYLGALRDALVRYIGRREFAQAVKLLLDLLASPPRDGALIDALARWPEAPAAPAA